MLTPSVSRTPTEIGTSMLARPTRRDRQADWKNGMPANRAQGRATAPDRPIITVRVCGPSSWPNKPAQSGTENIMVFIAPKPATASARIRRRPSWSRAAAAAAGSNGVAA